MILYRDADADLSLIRSARVAILGYGGQGRAQALNLRDSGVSDVAIGLRPGSASHEAATAERFRTLGLAEAARWADVVMVLTPDEVQPQLWTDAISPNLRPGSAVGFAHGLAVHFGYITPAADTPVFLIAPKGPGHQLRTEFQRGAGLPCLLATHGAAESLEIAKAYGSAIGCGRSAMIRTSFEAECVTDLFGEQAVLCGGLPDLLQAGYETLVNAGHPPELAYFECVHEAKLIVDLIYHSGFDAMRQAISNTAEFGGHRAGERLVTEDTRRQMRAVLDEVTSGRFAAELMKDEADGGAEMARWRARSHAGGMEAAGRRVRSLMPWIG